MPRRRRLDEVRIGREREIWPAIGPEDDHPLKAGRPHGAVKLAPALDLAGLGDPSEPDEDALTNEGLKPIRVLLGHCSPRIRLMLVASAAKAPARC